MRISDGSSDVGSSDLESDGRRPEQPRNDFGRRENYTLEQLNQMREVFGTQPHRGPEDEPMIIPFQNFNGGVGKSTLAIHAAQYLAVRGYRVLLIAADAQASTTLRDRMSIVQGLRVLIRVAHGSRRFITKKSHFPIHYTYF